MPYISRDQHGAIIEMHQYPANDQAEWLDKNHPEVTAFLQQLNTISQAKAKLASSDSEMARVIEDLVDLLIKKKCFNYLELPEAVQKKLGTRKAIREEMHHLGNLIDNEDNIL